MMADGVRFKGALPCVVCRHGRQRKTAVEWKTWCGNCRGLSDDELELLHWFQERDNDHVVVPPNIFRHSRENSRRRYEAVRDALEAHGVAAGARLLDIGCGISANADLFERYAYLGADVNIPKLGRALAKHPWACFAAQDITHMGWAPASFDAAICLEVIEHLPPDVRLRLVRELRRVLRPGGLLLLSTPNGSLGFWKHVLGKKCERSHEEELAPDAVRELVKEAGGRVVNVSPVDNCILPAGRLFAVVAHLVADRPALRRRVARAAMRAGYETLLYTVRFA
jgi:SAM-dependent methyltransferase